MIRLLLAERRLLATAVVFSLVVHAALLSIRFVSPPSTRAQPFDSRLPVILVNGRSTAEPLKADALAQTSMDGGGNADAGRARSPLPDLGRVADGVSVDAQRKLVADLEQRQQHLLQLLRRSLNGAPDVSAPPAPHGGTTPTADTSTALARRQAEVARDIADYQARPLKRQLTPNTRAVPFALYYTALRKKIEHIGTVHFPQHGGVRLYGELVISIPLRQDGSVYDAEGGPRIEQSSGNPLLDAAALSIVRRAAPFGRLPATLDGDGREQVWEVLARFSFTREQRLETQSLAESKE